MMHRQSNVERSSPHRRALTQQTHAENHCPIAAHATVPREFDGMKERVAAPAYCLVRSE
jgi:hypothetical protein